jgi:hypothetical protein
MGFNQNLQAITFLQGKGVGEIKSMRIIPKRGGSVKGESFLGEQEALKGMVERQRKERGHFPQGGLSKSFCGSEQKNRSV